MSRDYAVNLLRYLARGEGPGIPGISAPLIKGLRYGSRYTAGYSKYFAAGLLFFTSSLGLMKFMHAFVVKLGG